MKQLIIILITALLAWLASRMFAWWMIAVIPFLVAVVLKQKRGAAFLTGFISIALLWLYLIVQQDMANDYLLSTRMSQLFGLQHTLFIMVNIFLGALVGGLGGWSGAAMRRIFREKNFKLPNDG